MKWSEETSRIETAIYLYLQKQEHDLSLFDSELMRAHDCGALSLSMISSFARFAAHRFPMIPAQLQLPPGMTMQARDKNDTWSEEDEEKPLLKKNVHIHRYR